MTRIEEIERLRTRIAELGALHAKNAKILADLGRSVPAIEWVNLTYEEHIELDQAALDALLAEELA